MPRIYEMSPHLADLIAAGEVVERPASVVKELTENSVDAGARFITVEIAAGGMALVRVTDDGCGIAPEDVETAFLRHATSKLRREEELAAIGTLGFRGEALAAIASVSKIELRTRERGAAEGVCLTLEAGVKRDKAPVGTPEGTTIAVRDLFYNTPARQKFMKNDRAESAAVASAVTRLALSHPEISVRYVRDGREELHTPGDGRLQSAAYCALGRDFARGLLEAQNKMDAIAVSGYVSTPAAARGNRSWQFFFINGRFIKSKLLQAAVEQAYKNSLFTGRFPVCLLNVELPLGAVDVNVHPTKLEVRFADERAVFDAVYWAVRGALEREDGPAELPISRSTLRAAGALDPKKLPGASLFAPEKAGFSSAKSAPSGNFFRHVPAQGQSKPPRPSLPEFELRESVRMPDQSSIPLPGPTRPIPSKAPEPAPAPAPDPDPAPQRDWRYVGEALNTYILVERGESLFLIDKHAAHERMLFDKLKSRPHEPTGQLLLSPVLCDVDGETAGILLENANLLADLGFELDDFGDGSIAIRAVPLDMDLTDPAGTLEEIAGKLKTGGKRDVEAMRDDVLHTVACKAAIKAGKRSDPQELTSLVDKVLSGEVRYCPHGRPVSLELTRSQLDRSFKRA